MTRRPPHSQRRGYTILLVMIFLVAMLTMLGATFRQMATTLRVETARSLQVQQRQTLEKLGSRWVASQVLTSFEQNGAPDVNPPPSPMIGPDGTTYYNVTCVRDPSGAFWVVSVTPASP